MKKFLINNWFLVSLFVAILFSSLFSTVGISLNPHSISSTIAVAVIFFISGISLPTEEIITGISGYKLHIFIQIFIFVICPVYFLATSFPFKNFLDGKLIIGIYALAVLPTSISTCVIFTQICCGNIVATVFNSTFANIFGIVISPAILTLMLKGSNHIMSLNDTLKIIWNLFLVMLLPFIIGQIFHLFIGKHALKQKKSLSNISSMLILFIVFVQFSKTFSNSEFMRDVIHLWIPFLYLVVSHVLLVCLAFFGARFFMFSEKDIITSVYTAPQKTLAMGIPLITTYFKDQPALLGVAIIPILFYHPIQLMGAGILKNYVPRYAKAKECKITVDKDVNSAMS